MKRKKGERSKKKGERSTEIRKEQKRKERIRCRRK
jgi:hypothetical protein